MADPSRPSAATEPHASPELAATPARQGRYGRPVFWVLVISTVLAAIGLLAAWAWKAPALSRTGSQQASPQNGAAFHAPEPAPVTAPPGADHLAPQKPGAP